MNYSGGSKKQKQADTELLGEAAFVPAADEQLRASHGRQGFSLVLEFKSTASAKAAAAYLLNNLGSGDNVPSKAGAPSQPVITGVKSLFKRMKAPCP